MKSRFRQTLGLLLVGLAAGASAPASADLITLRADEWCPYNCAPDSDKPGYLVEIAKRVFEGAGHQVDYQLLNWARAIEETRAGKYTAIVGAARGDAEDFVFPAEVLGKSVNAFVARKDDPWSYTGIASLENRKLGVVRDYSYNDAVDGYVEAHKNDAERVQIASGDNALEVNLRKLQKGRLDTVVDGQYVLTYTLTRLGLNDSIHLAGADDSPDPIYIAFSPKAPKAGEYAELLATGVAAMRASGELQQILAKYGLSDWQ
ncbi:substrate-binding periplasmic protein [Endothiovibrio diazotrophicus]